MAAAIDSLRLADVRFTHADPSLARDAANALARVFIAGQQGVRQVEASASRSPCASCRRSTC
jgi:hypothetical protein